MYKFLILILSSAVFSGCALSALDRPYYSNFEMVDASNFQMSAVGRSNEEAKFGITIKTHRKWVEQHLAKTGNCPNGHTINDVKKTVTGSYQAHYLYTGSCN